MDQGDLHWQRIEAGIYETMYFAGEYKYRIVNDNRDYGPPNEWHMFYIWSKTPKEKRAWKRYRVGYTSTWENLKSAKRAALAHNMKPRTKWKYKGVATSDDVSRYERDKIGMLMYVEIAADGSEMKFSKKFMPRQEVEVDVNEEALRQKEIDDLNEMIQLPNIPRTDFG